MCQTLLALTPPNGKITFEDLPDRFRRSCLDKVTEQSAAPAISPLVRPTSFDSRTAGGHGLTSPTLSESAIAEALRMESGNISRAARRLGVHRSTLYRHLPQTIPNSSSAPAHSARFRWPMGHQMMHSPGRPGADVNAGASQGPEVDATGLYSRKPSER